MAHQTLINYQKLTINALKTKYPSFVLGIISVILFTLVSLELLSDSQIFSFRKQNDQKGNMSNEKQKDQSYTVQEGDDLWKIAEKVYGSGYNAYDISVANNITNPNILVAGQTLKIPVVTPQPSTQGEMSSASTSQVTNTSKVYLVKSGDDLGKIAAQVYGDPEAWKRIADANNLTDPNILHEGNILIIPR